MMFSTYVEDEGFSLKRYRCGVNPPLKVGRREGALSNTVISSEVLIGARITGRGGWKWPCLTCLSPKRY